MVFEIKYTLKAKRDIFTAMDYYENEATEKLAKFFFISILEAENTLKSTNYFEQVYKDFYLLTLRNFPYIFIYKIENETKTIRIYRVFPTSEDDAQNPED